MTILNEFEPKYMLNERVTIAKYASDFEISFRQPRPPQLDLFSGISGIIKEVIPGRVFLNIEGMKELDCYKVVFDAPIDNPYLDKKPLVDIVCTYLDFTPKETK